MRFEGLTDAQKDKIAACKSPEDILALAREEGYELSEEELGSVAGGEVGWTNQGHLCPFCKSRDTVPIGDGDWRCNNCGHEFDRTAPN